jgi:hypothetical protein
MTDEDTARRDDYRFQMGHDAGNLAMALDQLTDAITALNQHAIKYKPTGQTLPANAAEVFFGMVAGVVSRSGILARAR